MNIEQASPFVYVYIALAIADVLWLILALMKKDYEAVPAFVVMFPLFIIGVVTSIPHCGWTILFCIGQQ